MHECVKYVAKKTVQNIKKEIDGNKLELLIIASYLCGFIARADGKSPTSPDLRAEWKRLKELLYSSELQ
mgnify:CR=1 FL=1